MGYVRVDESGYIFPLIELPVSGRKSSETLALPRFGYKPLTDKLLEQVIYRIVKRNNAPMNEHEIIELLTQEKIIMSNYGKK